ncbi:hypothetical protein C8Q79DRAFT_1012603 [Trametes meyenii]|nr:hypothetical protein C8Q79DRAFT_1012603 [Trametes meyenii]
MSVSSTTGLCIVEDSGAPAGSVNYTTLVILHGYSWVSDTFTKLIPLSQQYNTRVILVNRRDYRGARPYDDAERALLPVLVPELDYKLAEIASATRNIDVWMKDRAREVYNLLAALVNDKHLPIANSQHNEGGIIVAGWSFGSVWATALLAHVSSFTRADVDLNLYVRRVVVFDTAYHTLGYPAPEGIQYRSFFDPKLPPEEQGRAFSIRVSGYYVHGDTPDSLGLDTPLQDPSPTFLRLTPEEISRLQYNEPGLPGGTDSVLLDSGLKLGLFSALRQASLYLPAEGDGRPPPAASWPNVEFRFVFCERSVWEVCPGLWALRKELDEAKGNDLRIRNVRVVLARGANHFVAWDNPDLAIRALVEEKDEVRE